MIDIESVTIATPSTFTVRKKQIRKKLRTASGKMIIKTIASEKDLLEFSYNFLSESDASTLYGQLVAATFLTVEYPCPEDGAIRSAEMTVSDRTCEALDYQSATVRWKNIVFQLEEQ